MKIQPFSSAVAFASRGPGCAIGLPMAWVGAIRERRQACLSEFLIAHTRAQSARRRDRFASRLGLFRCQIGSGRGPLGLRMTVGGVSFAGLFEAR